MAVHFKVYDKHLQHCQTNIARLTMFSQQSGGGLQPSSPPPARYAMHTYKIRQGMLKAM